MPSPLSASAPLRARALGAGLALAASLSGCGGQPAAKPTPAPEAALAGARFTPWRTEAGIQALALPRPAQPVIAAHLILPGGYVGEPDDQRGAAVALAWWLSAPEGPLHGALAPAGGHGEAWATPDAVKISLQGPPEAAAQALKALSKALDEGPKPEALQAIQAAYSELAPDDPLGRVIRQSYGDQPMALAPGRLGPKAITAEALMARRRACGVLQGASLVLSGPGDLRALAERLRPGEETAKAKTGRCPWPAPGAAGDPAEAGLIRVERREADHGGLWLALPAPTDTPEAAAQAALLGASLGLELEARGQAGLDGALSAASTLYLPPGPGRLIMSLRFGAADLALAWGALIEAAADLSMAISPSARQAAQRRAEGQWRRLADDPQGEARWLGGLIWRYGPEGPDRYLQALAKGEGAGAALAALPWAQAHGLIQLPAADAPAKGGAFADGLRGEQLQKQLTQALGAPPPAPTAGEAVALGDHLWGLFLPHAEGAGITLHGAVAAPGVGGLSPRGRAFAEVALACPGAQLSLSGEAVHWQIHVEAEAIAEGLDALGRCMDGAPGQLAAARLHSAQLEISPLDRAVEGAMAQLRGAPGLSAPAEGRALAASLRAGPRAVVIEGVTAPPRLMSRVMAHVGAGGPLPRPGLQPAASSAAQRPSGRGIAHLAVAFPTPAQADPPWLYRALGAAVTAPDGPLREMLDQEVSPGIQIGYRHLPRPRGGALIFTLSAPSQHIAGAERRLRSALERLKVVGIERAPFERLRRRLLGAQAVALAPRGARLARIAEGIVRGEGDRAEGLLDQDARLLQSLAPLDIQNAAEAILGGARVEKIIIEEGPEPVEDVR